MVCGQQGVARTSGRSTPTPCSGTPSNPPRSRSSTSGARTLPFGGGCSRAPTTRRWSSVRRAPPHPGVDHNRRLLLDRILRARIPDEFAKLARLRALADDGIPDGAEGPPVDLRSVPPAKRQLARLAG